MADDVQQALLASAELAELPAEALAALGDAMATRRLLAGEVLFEAGSPADGMVLVDRGRLGVAGPDGDVVATIGRGQVVGEMGALTGAPRSSTVIALRDTSLLEVDQAAFDRLFDASPRFGRALSRLVVERLAGEEHDATARSVPTTVAVVTVGGPSDVDLLVKALDSQVRSAAFVGADLADGRTDAEILAALETLEDDNDLVVLLGGDATAPDAWFDRCLRQADAALVIVSDPWRTSASLAGPLGERLGELRTTVELVVVNPSRAEVGCDASPWVERLDPDRIHHLRTGDAATFGRCARLVLGQGTGLLFSGGAAKGLAHLGAWRAICELGVEIDAVAGVSFGALMGAGVALDYTPEQLLSEVDERLVQERGLVDVTFPWMALLRGQGVSRRLQDVARGRRFEQVWRNFVCTSCDLVTGETVEHRNGLLWEAIRASVSIPGVLPPFRAGDRLLVDGAVRNNLPIAALRAGHPTPLKVIAVDVGKEGAMPAGETPDGGHVSGWHLMFRRLNPRRPDPGVPSMAQVLMRVMELAGEDTHHPADVVIRPDLSALGVGDFEQLDQFAQAGYDATVATLG